MTQAAHSVPDSRYRAFISYSHADRRWGDWLHRALETYHVPSRLVGTRTSAGEIPRRLAPIFRDREELSSAADLNAKVNEALHASANLIVICSPRAATSRWVNEEVLEFKRLGRGGRIFCLIVDGEPNAGDIPGRESEECFCPALRYQIGTDGELTDTHAEPIAADARAGKDGKANAKLKLIAGLLDVGFDVLRQREQQRRVRRMAFITAFALMIMLVTTTLAVYAVIARRAAVTAQQTAERRQKQAENLVDFMLGNLNDKLREVNRLDILQDVDDKAMDYFQSLPTADVTDQSLAQRAKALKKIGGVRMDQGMLPKALAAFGAAKRIDQELLKRSPNDPARISDYAESLNWIGNALWFEGNLKDAAQNIELAGDALEKAVAIRPDDTDYSYALATTHSNLGHVLERRNNYQAANRQYERVLKIFERLLANDPESSRWKTEVAYAHNNLGKLHFERGNLGAAIDQYLADEGIKSKLTAGDPRNNQWKENAAVSDASLSRMLVLAGYPDSGTIYLNRALELGKELVDFDPTNTFPLANYALYRLRKSMLLREQGEFDKALALVQAAHQDFTSLVKKSPAEWLKLYLAQSQIEMARLRFDLNDIEEAGKSLHSALATLKPLLHKQANDTAAFYVAQAYLLIGMIQERDHQKNGDRDAWKTARQLLAKLVQSGHNPDYLDAWSRVNLLLGDRQSAATAIAQLAKLGYRERGFVNFLKRQGVSYSPKVISIPRAVTSAMADQTARQSDIDPGNDRPHSHDKE